MDATLLKTESLCAGYGSIQVVHDLDLEVRPGEVVALLGANGAGKTTTLLTLAGELPPIGGRVAFNGNWTNSALHRRARNGLGFVTEERSIFKGLSTEENFRVGRVNTELALELFPELGPRLKVKAGLLSGGEQQMLTLARVLSRRPKLLLADELSLGLAPLVVDRLLQAVRQAADSGLGVLLVEQHVRKVLRFADRGYVIRRGRIVLQGTSTELSGQLAEIESTYLAAGGPGEPGEDIDEQVGAASAGRT
jgi:ABC-type branched-subunit amino acid transport system ATPase component